MSKERNKNKILNIISVILVIIILIAGYFVFKEGKDAIESRNLDKAVFKIVEENLGENNEFTRDTLIALKALNQDLVGYIEFDSGLISLPIVQGEDNDEYLRKAFNGDYSSQGSVFLDSTTSFDVTNPIIYGHNVLYDDSTKFSPLKNMVKQEFYEENSTFKIYLADEIRHYAITNVYYFNIVEDLDYNYMKPVFNDQTDFEHWYQFPSLNNQIVSINGKIQYDDNMITLQTCKNLDDEVREIVLAKLISTEYYN